MVKKALYVSPSKPEKVFLDYFQEEIIDIECNPRDGNYCCGSYPLVAKQMTIKAEMEYELFRSLMYLGKKGNLKYPGPYWVTC